MDSGVSRRDFGLQLARRSLAEFRDDLNLTASQRPSWDHYAGALRAFARDAERERSRARTFADMTLQQRIDHQVEAARDRYAAMEDIADAARALYVTLAPAQRAAANPRLAGIVEMIAGPAPAAASPPTRRARGRRDDESRDR